MFVQTVLVRRVNTELLPVPEDPRCILLGHCRVILTDHNAQVQRHNAVQFEVNGAYSASIVLNVRSNR